MGDHLSTLLGTVVIDMPVANARLLVAYCGEAPMLTSQHSITGSGLDAIVQLNHSQVVWRMSVGEVDPPVTIDFGAVSFGELVLTYNTRDPRRPYDGYVPFVTEVLHFGKDGSLISERKVVLPKEEFSPARAREYASKAREAIRSDQADSIETFSSCLGKLRNMGIDSPSKVMNILDELSHVADGAYSELVGNCRAEIQTIADITGAR